MFKQLPPSQPTPAVPTFPSKTRCIELVSQQTSSSTSTSTSSPGKNKTLEQFKEDTIKPGDLPDSKRPVLKTPQPSSENMFENIIQTIDQQLEKATKFIDKLQEEYITKLRSAEDSKKVLQNVKSQLEEKLDQEKARGQKRERTKWGQMYLPHSKKVGSILNKFSYFIKCTEAESPVICLLQEYLTFKINFILRHSFWSCSEVPAIFCFFLKT